MPDPGMQRAGFGLRFNVRQMIILKSERDLEAMRPACAIAGAVLNEVAAFIKPGVTTKQVDEFAAERIKQLRRQERVFGLSQVSVPDLYLGERTGGARVGRRRGS